MTTQAEKPLETYESAKPMNLEPGIYPSSVGNIEEINGTFGLQWRFEFTINEYPDEAPWAWATAKLGTKTKLYKWASTLLGRPLAIGEKLTRAQLIGLPCNVIIKEVPDAERDSGFKRYVDDILAVKKAAGKATAAAPLEDKCFCGKAMVAYAPDGKTPLCENHAKEAAE